MENDLALGILAGGEHGVIEHIILNNSIGNAQDIEEPEQLPLFNLDEMDEMEVKLQFRFTRADIHRLKQLLRIPDELRIEQRYVVLGKYLIRHL